MEGQRNEGVVRSLIEQKIYVSMTENGFAWSGFQFHNYIKFALDPLMNRKNHYCDDELSLTYCISHCLDQSSDSTDTPKPGECSNVCSFDLHS